MTARISRVISHGLISVLLEITLITEITDFTLTAHGFCLKKSRILPNPTYYSPTFRTTLSILILEKMLPIREPTNPRTELVEQSYSFGTKPPTVRKEPVTDMTSYINDTLHIWTITFINNVGLNCQHLTRARAPEHYARSCLESSAGC